MNIEKLVKTGQTIRISMNIGEYGSKISGQFENDNGHAWIPPPQIDKQMELSFEICCKNIQTNIKTIHQMRPPRRKSEFKKKLKFDFFWKYFGTKPYFNHITANFC